MIIPADRRYDWSAGVNVGVVGGIQSYGVVGANVRDYGAVGDGVTDDYAAIVAALAAAPYHSDLYFPAGRYRAVTRINATRSGICWRGDGLGNSIILPEAGAPLYVGNTDWLPGSPTPSVTITGGAVAGSTSITVNDASGITAFRLITITQLNPAHVHFNSAFYGAGPTDDGHGSDRLMAITVLVTAKVGNTLTLDHPLPIDFTDTPKVTPWNQYIVEGTGFENLTFDMVNSTANTAVLFNQAYGCWCRNIEIKNASRRQLWFNTAANCEVRKIYTHDTIGSGPNHEGIDFFQNCCFNLVEDVGCDNAGYPMIILGDWGGGCCCNVIAYNYLKNLISGSSVAGFAMASNHGAHNMFNLFEGNHAQNFASDGYYGSSSHNTLFRNRFTGVYDRAIYDDENAINLCHWAHYYNVVGNVLGTAGYSSIYAASGSGYQDGVVYRLGYPNAGNRSFSGTNANPSSDTEFDTDVVDTMIRHGNWDAATNGIVWDAGIADHVIPVSLFTTKAQTEARGMVWGALAHPPFDPAVPLNESPLLIPAGLRLEAPTAPALITAPVETASAQVGGAWSTDNGTVSGSPTPTLTVTIHECTGP